MSDDLVMIKRYNSTTEAEMDRGLLKSLEIEAMVQADNAGGTYPQFDQLSKGVRLFVHPDRADEAREILEARDRES